MPAENVADLHGELGIDLPIRHFLSKEARELFFLLTVSDEMGAGSDDRVSFVPADDLGRGLDLVYPVRFVPISSDAHTLARVYGPV